MILKRAAALQEEVAALSGHSDFVLDLSGKEPGSAALADPGGLWKDPADTSGAGTSGADASDSAYADSAHAGTAFRISQMQMEMRMRRFLAQRTKLLSCIEEISALENDLSDPSSEAVRTTLEVSRQSLLQLLAHVESEIHLYQTLQDQLQTGTMAADMLRAAGQNEQLAEFRKRLKEEADSV